ncbi:MAG TPA: YihY/virulence factor BrkB family protein, partial [Bacilli bacterium]|nr:YihY/virulence factor BrkB family protein [Bacilli bacterium]
MKKNKRALIKLKLKKYFSDIFKIIMMPEMAMLPGQVAFFLLLSLVPIITLACYLAQTFGFSADVLTGMITDVIPGGGKYLIPNLVDGSLNIPTVLVLIWMFYIATNGCNTIILISNQIYGLKQSTWIARRIKSMFMTIAIVALLIFLLLVSVYGVRFADLFTFLPYGDKIYEFLRMMKMPVIFIILIFFLKAFYNFAPDRLSVNNHINVGSIFTAIGWLIITLIYGFAANNMNNYQIAYGDLANIAILMVWLYFISYIFV